jgi:hypothetical protein
VNKFGEFFVSYFYFLGLYSLFDLWVFFYIDGFIYDIGKDWVNGLG